ncbi:endochitinase A-like [Phragmites australis]|uniref:endochitinase A-like n=1 Tax=Phragmites australis TaxID=29695 RepID=UPI002D790AC1|nr:endochitinase A-like [Phragmites australis]
MKPTTSTATPPVTPAPAQAEPCSHTSGATKRQRKAAAVPLSDVTNLLLPDTPTPIKPRRTGRRPLPPPSDASSTCSSTASVTPAPKPSSAAALEEESSVVKSVAISTVYKRRGTTEAQWRVGNTSTSKGKAPAAAAAGAASCPPLGKATRNNNRKTSMDQDARPISYSAPCHEAKKKRPSSSTPKLPEDFVKKQRAYFADIDAFELPEEEVSETDLE